MSISKIPNIGKSDSRHQFCTKTPSLFLRHLLDLQKTFKLHAKLLSFPLKYDSNSVNIFIKIQLRLYQKSIRASLEKMAGAHRSFFLGYKDALQKLRFMQGSFMGFCEMFKFFFSFSNVKQTLRKVRLNSCRTDVLYYCNGLLMESHRSFDEILAH